MTIYSFSSKTIPITNPLSTSLLTALQKLLQGIFYFAFLLRILHVFLWPFGFFPGLFAPQQQQQQRQVVTPVCVHVVAACFIHCCALHTSSSLGCHNSWRAHLLLKFYIIFMSLPALSLALCVCVSLSVWVGGWVNRPQTGAYHLVSPMEIT